MSICVFQSLQRLIAIQSDCRAAGLMGRHSCCPCLSIWIWIRCILVWVCVQPLALWLIQEPFIFLLTAIVIWRNTLYLCIFSVLTVLTFPCHHDSVLPSLLLLVFALTETVGFYSGSSICVLRHKFSSCRLNVFMLMEITQLTCVMCHWER